MFTKQIEKDLDGICSKYLWELDNNQNQVKLKNEISQYFKIKHDYDADFDVTTTNGVFNIQFGNFRNWVAIERRKKLLKISKLIKKSYGNS